MRNFPEDARRVGTVVWFSDAKGFGFIHVDGVGDVFCHYSAIKQPGEGRRSLLQDQRVELQVVKGPKGLLAAQVEVTA
jgi:CspA family cold shock protein